MDMSLSGNVSEKAALIWAIENKGLTTNKWINPSATYIVVMLNLRSYA